MKSQKLSLVLFLLSFCSFTHINAQLQDTIFIFDEVHVTDTVWVDQPVHFQNMLALNPEELFAIDPQKSTNEVVESLHYSKNLEFNSVAKSGGIDWAQFKDHLSVFVKGNAAMQIHWTDKTNGPDGEFPIATLGFGAASSYHLNKSFAFEPKLSFLQKGCQIGYLYDSIDGSGNTKTKIGYEGLHNRFNYVSADLILKIGKNTSSKFSPHVYGGLRGDLLLWNKVEYLVDQGFSDDPIFEAIHQQMTDYKDFHRLNYGWVAGFGAEVNNKWYLQFEVNSDIGYLAKGDRFRAQNLMASINAGVCLSAFKK